MDYTYASEISHTRAKVGDTERWAAGLSPLLDAHKSVKLTHRELIKMDTTVLDIELKKASVIRSELEVRLFVYSPAQTTSEFPDHCRCPELLSTASEMLEK